MTSKARPTRCASAFTMVEMVVSLAIMTVLLSAMASAVVLASRALPDESALSIQLSRGFEACDRMGVDLGEATSVSETGDTAVAFEVPDRGQEADGPESVRYAWSGTPGDPLTLEFNGDAPTTVCENVHAFSIKYTYQELTLEHPPNVMLIAGNKTNPGSNDRARIGLLSSWGFPVEVYDSSDSAADLRAGEQSADVVYVSDLVDILGLGITVKSTAKPVVNESALSNTSLGIAGSDFVGLLSKDTTVTDNGHPVTSSFALGKVSVASAATTLAYVSNLAPGARELASYNGSNSALVVVDRGGLLYDGTPAPARRVAMPWGGLLFDFGLLTEDAHALLRRALVWAATPVGLRTVTLSIQVGDDPADTFETTIEMLNSPGVE